MLRRRGRPKKCKTKSHFVGLRLSDEEYNELMYICNSEGRTQSDVLIKGLKSQSILCKFNEEHPSNRLDFN